MATSQELNDTSKFTEREPVVQEIGQQRFHEVGEEMQVARFYKDQRARAEERGVSPDRVTALQTIGDAIADRKRQEAHMRALAEEMGPFPRPAEQPPTHDPNRN